MQKSEFFNQIPVLTKSLKPFALNMTKNHEDMEDLIQDTYMRAINNFDKFQQGTNIKAWLFTIMKNIFINEYRRKQRQQTTTDNTENQSLLNNGKNKTFNLAERTILEDELNHAITSIKPDLSHPFMMHFQGFKYEEIADKLDLPLGTVKSRIFLARKEMQAVLERRGIESTYKVA